MLSSIPGLSSPDIRSNLQPTQVVTIKDISRVSLVVQWLRIHLAIQGTWVRPRVWEDPTCCEAAKPRHHSYWAHALEPVSCNYWAQVLHNDWSLHAPEPVLCNKTSPCTATREQPLLSATKEARTQKQRPSTTKQTCLQILPHVRVWGRGQPSPPVETHWIGKWSFTLKGHWNHARA